MLNFPRWKIWAITLTCVFGVLLAIPSMLPENVTRSWPDWAKPTINLGLDLAGGSQLLMEADISSLSRQRLEAMEETVRGEMRRADIEIGELSTANNQLSFVVRNPAQTGAAQQRMRQQTQATL